MSVRRSITDLIWSKCATGQRNTCRRQFIYTVPVNVEVPTSEILKRF